MKRQGRKASQYRLIPIYEHNPQEEMPFGAEGARFLCNVLQHGVFLGIVVLLLMVIGHYGTP